MNVLDYIAHETERQSGTVREALGMVRAHKKACIIWDFTTVGPITESILIDWAKMMNPHITDYRRIPVAFNQGGHAVNHERIPHLMKNLVAAINCHAVTFNEQRDNFTVGFDRADYFVKEFLTIHPFIDCNGRVGSLLWNYLRGSIFDPEPMPYFFGKDGK